MRTRRLRAAGSLAIGVAGAPHATAVFATDSATTLSGLL